MAKTILIVDDEPEFCKMLESRLSKEGYEIILAGDGESALRKVKLFKPDLIILDVSMPKMDGGEVYQKLQENVKTQKIPVIFLTALKAKEDDFSLGYDVGLFTVFAKPFDPKELLGTIREMLGKAPL
ncbi:MAG: hypothetical protein A3G33_06200 [Omnitrophica bacterium RIFCSPLOWO2_12_FULL_44_17]|uniref:Response regulatory domain-containing protein n=1 Tax=Candidatus Danuiimicrobium aquiferis TaxID=1801832 RepID=A0A1G1KRC4_9BACT|nr:MAG: hypothetical protein A3B72_02685 [Omnitrophica bacterium RIFCSPHIGHO2_02_FULL_45_28]OGW88073.1 MAG: hypothetical protein A3E74_00595 [Omnitrophica bacterium RIFCSPHIGHO2_12_FULL_44_12]OGW95375.1 MAG: hypothetical protein A3G33_06200 [Omnitrophica bacterium RIFCSPLOWO2_12_FULL_44_17]OGX04077.1 MAG: hypothetical protein A3J12_08765 [Omnitrophica bacterium RIFCSPLOWO2_02_FULL_44_11]